MERVRGRSPVFRAAAELLDRPAPDPRDTRPLETPWNFLQTAAPNHSMMIVLGDFPPRTVPKEWRQIMQRYHPVGFRVEDPWERELPVRPAAHDLRSDDQPRRRPRSALRCSSPGARRLDHPAKLGEQYVTVSRCSFSYVLLHS
jgi:endonuclease/exonuclease/phosphatase family metal-dependent hydrolase